MNDHQGLEVRNSNLPEGLRQCLRLPFTEENALVHFLVAHFLSLATRSPKQFKLCSSSFDGETLNLVPN